MNGLPPLDRSAAAPTPGSDAPLRRACQEFESLFLLTMLREGRGASPLTSSGGDSLAVGIGRDMRDESLSQEMGRAGGLGLGDMLFRQVSVNSSEKTDKTRLLNPQVSSTTDDNVLTGAPHRGPHSKRRQP